MAGIPWQSEPVRGWGMAVGDAASVFRPRDADQVAEALAERHGAGGLALRGSGCSYGDAATNDGGRVLDLSGMNRILSFDPATGLARVEPGVRIRDLWRHAIPHGYWPAVVPGTMQVSMGG
ncbi:MAG: FAD-binding oxidoreductase, partial [Planctomycetota bacterium]